MRGAVSAARSESGLTHGILGIALLVLGEALIVSRTRPASDFYFPFVWLGFILLLDSAVFRQTERSLFMTRRRIFLFMFPVSSAFWWLFELFNQAVNNWIYVGAERYTSLGFVAFASLDFSTVLPAVWTAAYFIFALLPRGSTAPSAAERVPNIVLVGMGVGGAACIALPIAQPGYFFGLIWWSLFLLLDPFNYHLGRPSIVGAIYSRNWRLPLSFALGALLCGFCWECWNFWSQPKWIYLIPHVGFWHIFEMPLLGYGGYLPFGLELFAMTNLVLPLLRSSSLTIEDVRSSPRTEEAQRIS
jgi:hypothetical protein